jgi:5-methyltetrahydropteroyltriglutamate--homocysteine methyltransferase
MAHWSTQPLLTTVVGSYPTGSLPPRRGLHQAVEDQIAAGVELISDGQVRDDMVSLFASRIPGFERVDDATWVVRDALDPPDLPVAAADFALAQRLAAGRAMVKGIVTGPITLALASQIGPEAPYLSPQDPALILHLAQIQAREVAALVAAGAEVVQVDEPALAWAHGRAVSPELVSQALADLAALPACPVLHVCGDVRAIVRDLLGLSFAVLDVEGTGVDNLAQIDLAELEYVEGRVSYGCVDTQREEVESARVVGARVRAAARAIGAERLWVAPDCGLRQLTRESARAKLRAMVEAVQDIRAES